MNLLWKCQLALIVDALLAVGGPRTPAWRRTRVAEHAPPITVPSGQGAEWRRRARQPERNGRRLAEAHRLCIARGGGHLERQHRQPAGLG